MIEGIAADVVRGPRAVLWTLGRNNHFVKGQTALLEPERYVGNVPLDIYRQLIVNIAENADFDVILSLLHLVYGEGSVRIRDGPKLIHIDHRAYKRLPGGGIGDST